uniref:Uncharacterized protein n=1 Tax=viral metagenome TaxID=1070528 RepID=A0A6M3KHA7_9ZZZZ
MARYENLLHSLREKIEDSLELCDSLDTPYLCSAISDKDDKERLIKAIIKLVEKGYSIGEAINMLENDLDPNYEID